MITLPVYMIHWNAPEWASSAVKSILASEGVRVELTIIDNPSERSNVLRSAIPAAVEIVWRATNDGYTGGANEALRLWLARPERPEYCVICSHDLHVLPDTLVKMRDLLDSNPSCGVLEPQTWPNEPRGPHPAWRGPIKPVVWATGCCIMLRRGTVEGIEFDEKFGSYVEDIDFCLRVADRGWGIGLATQAVAWELGSASPRATAMVKANTVRLQVKRHGLIGGAVAVVSLVWDALRSGVGGATLWRSADKRKASYIRFRSCLTASWAIAQPSFWTRGTNTVMSNGNNR